MNWINLCGGRVIKAAQNCRAKSLVEIILKYVYGRNSEEQEEQNNLSFSLL
jgi:hypothetical protein